METLLREIHADIAARQSHAALYLEKNFKTRAETLDFLESDVIDRLDGLLLKHGNLPVLCSLKQSVEALKTRLEGVDRRLFQNLRQGIASGDCRGTSLRQKIMKIAGSRNQADDEYDNLDLLVSGLLLAEPAPPDPGRPAPEMLFYQPTPVRIILALVDSAGFGPQDLFYDIGSGLGQVPILAHLLSGVNARGVEVVPAYCAYAGRSAKNLRLPRVRFTNLDARTTDYSQGSVFFLYTPFEGGVLETVLERLRRESENRSLRIYTYGPCTPQVSRHPWLLRQDDNGDIINRLALFKTQ